MREKVATRNARNSRTSRNSWEKSERIKKNRENRKEIENFPARNNTKQGHLFAYRSSFERNVCKQI